MNASTARCSSTRAAFLVLIAVLGLLTACQQAHSYGFAEPEAAARACGEAILTGDVDLMRQATGRTWSKEAVADKRELLFELPDVAKIADALTSSAGGSLPTSTHTVDVLFRVKTDPLSPRAAEDGTVDVWMAVSESNGKWSVAQVYMPSR